MHGWVAGGTRALVGKVALGDGSWHEWYRGLTTQPCKAAKCKAEL